MPEPVVCVAAFGEAVLPSTLGAGLAAVLPTPGARVLDAVFCLLPVLDDAVVPLPESATLFWFATAVPDGGDLAVAVLVLPAKDLVVAAAAVGGAVFPPAAVAAPPAVGVASAVPA